MSLKDYKAFDIFSCPDFDDKEATLHDIVVPTPKNGRCSVFLGKIYAIQDLAINLDSNDPKYRDEIVGALIELGDAFARDFEKEIDRDNSRFGRLKVSVEKVCKEETSPISTGKTDNLASVSVVDNVLANSELPPANSIIAS